LKDSREKIFAAIRRGLHESEKFKAERGDRSPLKKVPAAGFESMFDKFQTELTKLGGEAVVFDSENESSKFIADHVGQNVFIYDEILPAHKSILDDIKVPVKTSSNFDFGYDKREAAVFESAISPCVACVAETGTVVIAGDMRLPAALATKLFIIAEPQSLISSLDDLFTDKYKNFKGSNLFLITGPSRTADIEKQLVTGVHGPKEVFVIFIRK
jgi:L-lactate dehydrogenase complex protein LldG